MIKLSIVTIFIAISSYCYAQDIPLAGAQFRYDLPTQIKGQPSGTKAAVTEQNYFVSFPLFSTPKTSLSTTARYSLMSPSMQSGDVAPSDIFDHTYQTLSMRFNLSHKLNDQWNIQLAVAPTLSSDFSEGLSGKDIIVLTQVVARKRVSSDFSYGIGLGYGTNFGKKMLLPALQLDYHANQFNVVAFLPSNLAVYYSTASNNLHLGGALHIAGGYYHIPDEVDQNKTINRVGYRNITIGPSVVIKIAGPLYLNLDGGYDLSRKFATYSDNKVYDDFTPAKGMFIQAGISLVPSRIKRKKNN